MTLPLFDQTKLPAWLDRNRRDFHSNYLAMYSSWFGGIVTDPLLMLIPADDHMVHRGDAVFEVFKCVSGSIYNLNAHLTRLMYSSQEIGIETRLTPEELQGLIIETTRAGQNADCTIRVFLSRGPGSFGVNPHDCADPQIYIVVTRRLPSFMQRNANGARVVTSSVPIKTTSHAPIKSCNYLANVLMEKEALDAGAHFAVAFDENGFLAEGATENFGIITSERQLLFPKAERILQGTTMVRVAELAQDLVMHGELDSIGFSDISRAAFNAAQEIIICGTTPDVTAVIEVDGRKIGTGRPGPVFKKLSARLLDDIAHNQAMLTRVF